MEQRINKTCLVLVFSLILLGLTSATECTPQTYDSCYLCMNTNVNPSTGLSDYVTQLSGDAHYYEPMTNTVCGPNSYYTDSNTGLLKLKTPSLPFTGTYTLRFYYGIGTPNDIGTEDFSVKCGTTTYYFPDNDDVGEEVEFRFGEVECDFNSGYNYVEFKSLDTGSVHFKKFLITGEKTCPVPPTPYCGDGTCNGLETCNTCPSDCGVCPEPEPYCGDGTCNGLETCNTCPSDCGICPVQLCHLELTKSVSKSNVETGDIVTYTLQYKNTGNAVCTGGGVKIQDVLNENLDYKGSYNVNILNDADSQGIDAGWYEIPGYNEATNTLTWNAHAVSPNEKGIITFEAEVLAPEECGDFQIPNYFKAWSDQENWKSSNTVNLNVDYNCPEPEPYCGDGTCNGDETCHTCPTDCGVCPEPEQCDLKNAHWNVSSAYNEDMVSLIVSGDNCEGKTIYFSIYKKQESGSDIYLGSPASATFSDSSSINTLWKTIAPYAGDTTPTYYFIARTGEGSEEAISGYLNVFVKPVEPYCGDDICNGDETCHTCPTDCGSCHDDDDDECEKCKEVIFLDTCESNWKCSGWSECSDGIMKRQCVDENHCENQYNMPLETSACTNILPVKIEEEKTCKLWWIWIIVAIILLIILIRLLA